MDACREPGASVAGRGGVGPRRQCQLVRRWLREQGVVPPSRRLAAEADVLGFMPVRLDPPEASPRDIRIELRRGGAVATLHWPLQAASDLGIWLQAWLR